MPATKERQGYGDPQTDEPVQAQHQPLHVPSIWIVVGHIQIASLDTNIQHKDIGMQGVACKLIEQDDLTHILFQSWETCTYIKMTSKDST